MKGGCLTGASLSLSMCVLPSCSHPLDYILCQCAFSVSCCEIRRIRSQPPPRHCVAAAAAAVCCCLTAQGLHTEQTFDFGFCCHVEAVINGKHEHARTHTHTASHPFVFFSPPSRPPLTHLDPSYRHFDVKLGRGIMHAHIELE